MPRERPKEIERKKKKKANLLAVHMFEIVADMEPQAVELQGV